MNYDQIKEYAAENGLRVKDLCALAPNNDPFYVGRPADLESAEWFRDLWEMGRGESARHIRRLHYIAATLSVKKPNGETYVNEDWDWNYINVAAKNARYLGLVPPELFVDNRNPAPIIHSRWITSDDPFRPPVAPQWEVNPAFDDYTDELYTVPDVPVLPDLPAYLPSLPNFYVDGYHVQQAVHVEIWCEKTTMNDILVPLCEKHGLVLVTGAGELSITAVMDFMHRVEQAERPGRILYISDYDPAGFGMPVSIARKIEHFQRNEGFGYLDIALRPVVLTPEQVELYRLPRVPGKAKDKRKKAWDALHGKGVVELDALEALHPGELAHLLEAEIALYRDNSLFGRSKQALSELRSKLYEGRSDILDAYERDIQYADEAYGDIVTDWATIQAEFNELVADFAEKLQATKSNLSDLMSNYRALCERIENDLEAVHVEAPDVPTANLPDEPDALYDSDRDYFSQLAVYKHHRNGTTQEALL